MAHLNKRMDLARFDRAAAFLADNGIDLRVFVLLGTPYVPKEEQVEWSVRSAEYAARRGASVVSVIPVRGGNGELERLGALGHFVLPTLAELQKTLEACLGLDAGSTVFAADLWDVERLPGCVQCRAQRIARIRRMNLTGRVEPAISCGECS
jgi:sugar phosphate isomerase/epimerase